MTPEDLTPSQPEFFTLDEDGNEVPIQIGDFFVNVRGIAGEQRIVRLDPLAHYGDLLQMDPELIDPMPVTFRALKRDSDTLTADQTLGEYFDEAEYLPVDLELAAPVTLWGQVETQIQKQMRPTRSGGGTATEGYVLFESSRDTPWHFFKAYYQEVQKGSVN